MQLYIGTKHGEIGLEDAEQLIAKYPRYFKRAFDHVVKSESWRMRGEIKRAIQQGGAAGSKWPKLNPHTGILNQYDRPGKWMKNYRKSRKGVKRGAEAKRMWRNEQGLVKPRLSMKSSPLLKLAGGTRYYYDPGMMTATIGFMSSRSPGATTILAKKHAMGFSVPVTKRSRRRAFGLGFPLSKEKTQIKIPARPVVGPVFEQEKGAIVQNVNHGVLSNIQSLVAGRGLIKK